MLDNLAGKVVLITGGTCGIGLSTGLAFGALQAKCVLTYHWGTADENEVRQNFKDISAPEPLLIRADVSNKDDTAELMNEIKQYYPAVDIFISNVAITSLVTGLEKYYFKDLEKSLSYSTWPTFEYLKQMKEIFARYPRYVVGISTTGIDEYNYAYAYVAACKVALETLCRYLSYRLRKEHININIIRTRAVRTLSLEKTFGADFVKFADHFTQHIHWMTSEEIANACVALCSGYLDMMHGQILQVDRGTSFMDDLMHLYTIRNELNIQIDD